MKALKIDPFVFLTADTIQSHAQAAKIAEDLFTEIDMQPGIDWMYPALSHTPNEKQMGEAQNVRTFEAAPFSAMLNYAGKEISTTDTLFVDEDGLYNNVNDVWIIMRGAWQPFAGAGLVLGTTPSGNSCAPKKITLDYLRKNCIILCQNLIYVPRVQRLGAVAGRAVHFAQKANMVHYNNTFWKDDNILR